MAYNNIKAASDQLGELKAKVLLFFHSFTGCDTTPSFRNKGKKSAWNTWNGLHDATNIFANLSTQLFQIMTETTKTFGILQPFVICLYMKSSPLEKVNDAQKEIFPLQKMLFFSIPKELFIKLAFGQNPLIAKHNCHLLLDLDGKKGA